jgi:proteic killer suppression protein
MIKHFKCKETSKIFNCRFSRKLPHAIQEIALRKLEMLDYAIHLKDLRVPPSNHLEILKGDRAGQHSIRINGQWRICFNWTDGNAYDVEIIDYH